jgi:hypothetical protein
MTPTPRNPVDDVPRQRIWYAHLLRKFIAGKMTNHQFVYDSSVLCDAFPHDMTIDAIDRAMWGFYCDTYEHRMTGRHRLQGKHRRFVAQMILLLRTGAEAAAAKGRWDRSPCWPFHSPLALEQARATQVFLCGKKACPI